MHIDVRESHACMHATGLELELELDLDLDLDLDWTGRVWTGEARTVHEKGWRA